MPGSAARLYYMVVLFSEKFETPKLPQITLEKCAINELRCKKDIEQVQQSTGYRSIEFKGC